MVSCTQSGKTVNSFLILFHFSQNNIHCLVFGRPELDRAGQGSSSGNFRFLWLGLHDLEWCQHRLQVLKIIQRFRFQTWFTLLQHWLTLINLFGVIFNCSLFPEIISVTEYNDGVSYPSNPSLGWDEVRLTLIMEECLLTFFLFSWISFSLSNWIRCFVSSTSFVNCLNIDATLFGVKSLCRCSGRPWQKSSWN